MEKVVRTVGRSETFTSERIPYRVVYDQSASTRNISDVIESCYYEFNFFINVILQITYFLQIFAKTLSKL